MKKMHISPFSSTAAVLVLLAEVVSAQNINTNTTIKASSFVGGATSDSYPSAGSE